MFINTLIKDFDDTLRKYNRQNYLKLQPSLPNDKIELYLKEIKVVNEDFRALVRWKNGFDFSDGEDLTYQLFDCGALLSMEHMYKLTMGDSNLWAKNFIPLITDGSGDFLLFNNSKKHGYGKLHLYSVSRLFIDSPISYYDSIATMLKTTIEAYQTKALKYDSGDAWLNQEFQLYRTIAIKHNPKSQYWTR